MSLERSVSIGSRRAYGARSEGWDYSTQDRALQNHRMPSPDTLVRYGQSPRLQEPVDDYEDVEDLAREFYVEEREERECEWLEGAVRSAKSARPAWTHPRKRTLSQSSNPSAHVSKTAPDFVHEGFRLLEGCEMPALLEMIPVHDVRVALLRPTA